MESADLQGADLQGADLQGADLRGADLRGADLRGADLHTHTTTSDGTLTPAEVVELAVEQGLVALGITDHDTTDGVSEARPVADRHGLWVVPGVELNTDTDEGHVDILGYFVDVTDQQFQDTLSQIRDARYHRARKMVDKLRKLGRPISFDRVLELSVEGAIGRPHVAQALLEAGHVSSISEAFEKYIGRAGPAYADRYRMSPYEACRLVREAGGVPSLAHPVPVSNSFGASKQLTEALPALVDAGLGALECYYPGYTPEVSEWLITIADRFDLVPTGGSDFHGATKPAISLGAAGVPREYVERLREAASTP